MKKCACVGDYCEYWQYARWKTENIQKEYLERDRVVASVTHIIHMNPDGNNGGDREHESTDTEDRSDCSPGEDMDL